MRLRCVLFFAAFFFGLLSFHSSAIAQTKKPSYIKISGERTFITTLGDAEGYSVATEFSKFYMPNINLGLEYRFASAQSKPYFYHAFYHKSVSYLEAKFNYYPFSKLHNSIPASILKGLSVGTGPSVFYGQFSTESQWESVIDVSTGEEIDRTSKLKLTDKFDVGYVVNISYEVNVTPSFLLGARVDWSNYRHNDGYSAYGLKAGFRIR